jgi:hypothetical protein
MVTAQIVERNNCEVQTGINLQEFDFITYTVLFVCGDGVRAPSTGE